MDLNCPGTITCFVLFFSPIKGYYSTNFYAELSSVQLLSRVRIFVTLWTASCQTSLSITNSWSLPKPMSIKSVMPSNHLILCRPLHLLPSIFPSIRVFHLSQHSASGSQSIGVSVSTSVLPTNTQDWSPLGWTGWISLQSKGLSRVFSNTTVHHTKWWMNHKPESRLPGEIPTTLDLPL